MIGATFAWGQPSQGTLRRLGCRGRAESLQLADGARELRVLPFECGFDMRSNNRFRNGTFVRPTTIGRK